MALWRGGATAYCYTWVLSKGCEFKSQHLQAVPAELKNPAGIFMSGALANLNVTKYHEKK